MDQEELTLFRDMAKRAFEKAITPPLAAEYTTSPEDPTRPASDETLTIAPPPRSIMPGNTA